MPATLELHARRPRGPIHGDRAAQGLERERQALAALFTQPRASFAGVARELARSALVVEGQATLLGELGQHLGDDVTCEFVADVARIEEALDHRHVVDRGVVLAALVTGELDVEHWNREVMQERCVVRTGSEEREARPALATLHPVLDQRARRAIGTRASGGVRDLAERAAERRDEPRGAGDANLRTAGEGVAVEVGDELFLQRGRVRFAPFGAADRTLLPGVPESQGDAVARTPAVGVARAQVLGSAQQADRTAARSAGAANPGVPVVAGEDEALAFARKPRDHVVDGAHFTRGVDREVHDSGAGAARDVRTRTVGLRDALGTQSCTQRGSVLGRDRQARDLGQRRVEGITVESRRGSLFACVR